MKRFRSLIPEHTADQFIDGVVDALAFTYQYNGERHEPEIGDDGQTFGNLCWRNGWFQLERYLGRVDGVSTSRPNNSLLIEYAGLDLHSYRGGPDENVDIDTFVFEDGSPTKAAIPKSNQLAFEFDESEEAVEPIELQLKSLAIVHYGNPDDGLCAVWIGAPLPKPAGMSPWEWREPLFIIRRDGDGVKIEDTPPVTPFSDGAVPEIAIERRNNTTDGGRAEPSAG